MQYSVFPVAGGEMIRRVGMSSLHDIDFNEPSIAGENVFLGKCTIHKGYNNINLHPSRRLPSANPVGGIQ